MATTPNDPYRRTDPAVEPGHVDPAARPADPALRDPNYREPVVTEDRSGGLGKWVMIAVAALAVALLISFFVGPDDDAVVATGDDGVVIEGTTDNVEIVETEQPLVTDGETVPLGEEVTAAGEAVETTVEGAAEATEQAATEAGQAIENGVEGAVESTEQAATEAGEALENAAGEATEAATAPIVENPGTDVTETGSIEVEATDGTAETDLQFREVEVQPAQ